MALYPKRWQHLYYTNSFAGLLFKITAQKYNNKFQQRIKGMTFLNLTTNTKITDVTETAVLFYVFLAT
jgi:hypothetical protein